MKALLYREVEGDRVPTNVTITIWKDGDQPSAGLYEIDFDAAVRVGKWGDISLQLDRHSLIAVK